MESITKRQMVGESIQAYLRYFEDMKFHILKLAYQSNKVDFYGLLKLTIELYGVTKAARILKKSPSYIHNCSTRNLFMPKLQTARNILQELSNYLEIGYSEKKQKLRLLAVREVVPHELVEQQEGLGPAVEPSQIDKELASA